MTHRLASIALMGWVLATSQTTLLREVLAVAQGSELALGIALGLWLVLTALGSALSGWLPARHTERALALGALLVGPALVLALLGARALPRLFHLAPGELLGFDAQVLGLLIMLSPVCLAGGAVFTLSCRLPALDATAVYGAEALGWLAGGITATWIVETWPPFALAGGLATGALAATALLTGRAWLAPAVLVLGALTVGGLLSGHLARLEARSLAWRWPLQHIEASAYTRDGHAAVLTQAEQKALYEDGHLSVVLPERQTAEELVHLALAQVREPRRVLVVRGLGGLLPEILKHPVREVLLVEPNPAVARLQIQAADEATRVAMRDGRVRFAEGDVRRLMRTRDGWDAILLNAPEPSTLLASRLLTVESFAQARRALRPGGALAFALPGAENYYSPELLARNGSVWKALREVFPSVVVTPLATNYFLAGDGPLSLDAQETERRLAERHVTARFVDRYVLAALMPPERVRGLAQQYDALGVRASRDHAPTAFLHDLLFAGRADGGAVATMLRAGLRLDQARITLVLATPMLVFGLLSVWRRRWVPLLAVGALGFVGMAVTVLVLVVTQSALGALHHLVGLMLAANMAGLALGARLSVSPGRRTWLNTVGMAAVVAMSIPWLSRLGAAGSSPLMLVALMVVSALAGAVVGVAFRAALAAGSRPAAVYAVDLLGAALAAPSVATVLLPAHGLDATCAWLVLLLALVGLVTLLARRSVPDPAPPSRAAP